MSRRDVSASALHAPYTEAREECLHALALVADPGSDPEGVARRLHELGRRFGSQGKLAEAEELQRRVLALQGPTLFPVHVAAESLQGLVRAYLARGQHADAERLQAWLRQPLPQEDLVPTAVAQKPQLP